MFIAVRGNKQIKIDEKDMGRYAGEGFDICERNGDESKTVMHSANKTVPFSVHAELQAELEAAKATIAELQAELDSKQAGGKKKEG